MIPLPTMFIAVFGISLLELVYLFILVFIKSFMQLGLLSSNATSLFGVNFEYIYIYIYIL